MRLLILPMIFVGLLVSSNSAIAQDPAQIAAHEAAMSNPIVIAAYAKNSTPSGMPYGDKVFSTSSKNWFEGDLETANVVFAASPLKESSFSWLGRRHGFMGNYAKSIEVFTEGMELFPESYALYRYRGYHLVRNYQFEEGIADLRKAEELIGNVDVAPIQDGIPGKSNFSPSTFKRNIYYYLAQSSMATGDYGTVIEYMDKSVAANELRDVDDFLVATSFYKYMALRKLGRHEDAKELIKEIPNGLDIIENFNYHEAIKFLQGKSSRERFLTQSDSLGKYAIAMVDHFNGDDDDANTLWTEVTNNNPKGYWLAEVELLNSK